MPEHDAGNITLACLQVSLTSRMWSAFGVFLMPPLVEYVSVNCSRLGNNVHSRPVGEVVAALGDACACSLPLMLGGAGSREKCAVSVLGGPAHVGRHVQWAHPCGC